MTTKHSITIVGGGSAGWMTAIFLNKLYNSGDLRVPITVIESQDIGIIGVGEATVHTIRLFFAAMGLDELELLRESNATLKAGILFRNWKKPTNNQVHEYFHPFEQQHLGRVHDISQAWLLSSRRDNERYDQGVSLASHFIAKNASPKSISSKPYQGVVPYGYHLDAQLMARFLRRKAVEAGVTHIPTTVRDVEIADKKIIAVNTDAGRLCADFFIDCTGFRGLLIDRLQEGNWISYEDALPCNKAVAMQQNYVDTQSPKPYTVATALKNGWVWEIDLIHRRGTGYVYDGKRLTRDQAAAELHAHLGDHADILKTVHLDMKVGRRKEFWVGNCLAIGLAGGFIEPLESTGLHLINLGARMLATHSPSSATPQIVRDSYNRLMAGYYEDLKRFVVLHYCLSDRDDSEFWLSARESANYCAGLPELIELWRHKTCEPIDLAGYFSSVFTDENYRYILYGMQHYPRLNIPHCEVESSRTFAEFSRVVMQAVQATQSHHVYLETVRGMQAIHS